MKRLLFIALFMGCACRAFAQAPTESATASQLPALKQLSLEELLKVDVTLPLRRPMSVMEAPAAVSVITGEDVWRSGAAGLPEVLRNAPGLFVGRFTASSWVIAARGFASTSANKMLVMVDGRTVYSPLFAGVFWEQLDYPLFDLDRIEVVRGPGASLWGSNAVNGVINVVSKHARDTQGTVVSAATGAEEHVVTAMRHGGRVGNGFYRVFGKFADRDDAHLINGSAARDGQRLGLAGVRFDLGSAESAVTIQSDAFVSRVDLADRDNLEAEGGNVLARWSRQHSPTNHYQLQAYYDRSARLVPQQIEELRDTVDFDYQHLLKLGGRHALSWGTGYRISKDDTTPTALITFVPEDHTTHLPSGFIQDEVSLPGDVVVVGGVKLEHNNYTGIEAQPSLRARWSIDRTQNLWGGVSRAVRLPTRLDADVRITNQGRVLIAGNPAFLAERVIAAEVGYRINPIELVAVDITAFRNRYDNLRSQEPPLIAGNPVTVGNGLNATTAGLELVARVMPRHWLRLTTAYTYLSKELTFDPGSRDRTGGLSEAIDPRRQFLLQGRVDLPRRTEIDVALRRVSALPVPNAPAYVEANFRIAWRPSERLELSLVGRDVLHAQHVEFASPSSARVTALERALYSRVSVAF